MNYVIYGIEGNTGRRFPLNNRLPFEVPQYYHNSSHDFLTYLKEYHPQLKGISIGKMTVDWDEVDRTIPLRAWFPGTGNTLLEFARVGAL